MTIENLIKSIGKAVEEAHSAIERDYVSNYFGNYFLTDDSSEDTSKTYYPKVIGVQLPHVYEGQSERVVYTPVATLVAHNNLNLDYVKVNLNISVLDETNDNLLVTSSPANRNEPISENSAGMLELTFKCKDTPEGISRINTALNATI